MKASDYDLILKEHFDCDDDETRQIMLSIDESDQNQAVTALTSKLYDHIVKKVDDIDYGTIPNSQGDITKIENYDQMIDCIDIIKKYLTEFKQDTDTIDQLLLAIENIKERRDEFERGFKFQIEFIMVSYCNMVLAVISSLSFLITASVEFIKEPGNDNFTVTVDKVGLQKTKNNLLFTCIKKFNKSCKTGEFDKVMEYIIGNSEKHFMGSTSTLVAGVALTALILNIVPIMRELIFFFYHTRTSISDYFEIQADLLQMNAYNVEHGGIINSKEAKNVAAKQMKIVAAFRKLSNFFSIDSKQSEAKATKDISSSAKKYKADEIMDERPDSASSTGSLF